MELSAVSRIPPHHPATPPHHTTLPDHPATPTCHTTLLHQHAIKPCHTTCYTNMPHHVLHHYATLWGQGISKSVGFLSDEPLYPKTSTFFSDEKSFSWYLNSSNRKSYSVLFFDTSFPLTTLWSVQPMLVLCTASHVWAVHLSSSFSVDVSLSVF